MVAAVKIASRLVMPRSRSACSAKSIIMIAFFLTMPISRIMPMSAMIVNGMPHRISASDRADAGGGNRREDRDGMDEALVEHAQHDIDRGDGGE